MEERTNRRFDTLDKRIKPKDADDGDDKGVKGGDISNNNKSRGKSTGKINVEGASYAYLIIWPSPLKGNYIQAQGGVEVLHDQEKLDYAKGESVHYVKIGHQDELAKRVKSYNTHTPSSELPCDRPELNLLNRSVWFRHLQFEEQVNHEDKLDKLKALGKKNSKIKETSTSALYLEHMLLLPDYPKDYHAKEWFVIKGHTAELRKLCEKLDTEERYEPRGGGVKKIDVTLESEDGTTEEVKREANIYNNEDTCIEAFRDYAQNVFGKPKSS